MDVGQYDLMRAHILETIDAFADEEGSVPLKTVVATAQERHGSHELFPEGRVRNYCTYTKVDLEARGEIERVPGASPQAHPPLARRLMAFRPSTRSVPEQLGLPADAWQARRDGRRLWFAYRMDRPDSTRTQPGGAIDPPFSALSLRKPGRPVG